MIYNDPMILQAHSESFLAPHFDIPTPGDKYSLPRPVDLFVGLTSFSYFPQEFSEFSTAIRFHLIYSLFDVFNCKNDSIKASGSRFYGGTIQLNKYSLIVMSCYITSKIVNRFKSSFDD